MTNVSIPREVVEQALSNLESMAFSWKAPNVYTPQVVMWVQGMRSALSAAAEPVKVDSQHVFFKRKGSNTEDCLTIPANEDPKTHVADDLITRVVPVAASPSPAPAVPEQGGTTKALKDMTQSRNFYRQRVDLLMQWQSKMRDPERTLVCDIIANGQTLPDANGSRYGPAVPDAAKPETQGERELLSAKMIAAADWQEHGIHPSEPLFSSTDMRRIAALLSAGPAQVEPLDDQYWYAWRDVCAALDDADPQWYGRAGTGAEAACASIKHLSGIGKDQAS